MIDTHKLRGIGQGMGARGNLLSGSMVIGAADELDKLHKIAAAAWVYMDRPGDDREAREDLFRAFHDAGMVDESAVPEGQQND